MSKQSSVEWYINNLIDILGDEICNKLTIEQTNKIHNLGNQAVAMHKEEIKDSYCDGRLSVISKNVISADQYYKERFESDTLD